MSPNSKWRCEECLRKNREGAKKKRDENRGKFNAHLINWKREYRKKNIDKVRSWELKYSRSEKGKARRKRRVEKQREYVSRWQKENPEKMREYYKKYNTTHQPRLIAHAQKRGRLKKENGGTFLWSQWVDLCNKFGNICLWCGKKKKLTIDHVVPITKGGRNDIENIQPLCRNCNSKKNAKIIDFRPFGNIIMDWT